jgi:ParB-like chromosome segregation protein Spo0J
MGPFDWKKYTPIEVEKIGGRLVIQNGMTRVEAARRAGITMLPAYVFEDK